MKLYMGVMDKPYAVEGAPVRKGRRKRIITAGAEGSTHAQTRDRTTGQVATVLEDKYGIMQAFFDKHERDIADDLAEAASHSVEVLFATGQAPDKPLATAEDAIKVRFKEALILREFDGMMDGVPTKAAIKKDRQSFIDTGQYMESFVAWIE